MESWTREKRQIVATNIQQIPEFRNAGVVYYGDGMCELLRDSSLPRGLRTWVIIDRTAISGPGVSLERMMQDRQQRLNAELGNIFWNCAPVAITIALLAVGGAATAPVTMGGSVIAVVAVAGSMAGAAQCGLSVGRSINEVVAPESNDAMDSTKWLQDATAFLEGVSLVSSVVSIGQTAVAVHNIVKIKGIHAAAGSVSLADRRKLAKEIADFGASPRNQRIVKSIVARNGLPSLFKSKPVTLALLNRLNETIWSVVDVGRSSKNQGGLVNRAITGESVTVIHVVNDN